MEAFLRKELVEIFHQFMRKPYLDEYLAEKVDLIRIKSRNQKSAVFAEGYAEPQEFRCQNPGLVKEVVDILVRLKDET